MRQNAVECGLEPLMILEGSPLLPMLAEGKACRHVQLGWNNA